MMDDWRQQVQGSDATAMNEYAIITDFIDVDDTYHVEVPGYLGENALRVRTQQGVDDTLKEFAIPDTSWRTGHVEDSREPDPMTNSRSEDHLDFEHYTRENTAHLHAKQLGQLLNIVAKLQAYPKSRALATENRQELARLLAEREPH